MSSRSKSFIIAIVVGVILVIVGLCIRVPGGRLITDALILDGEKVSYESAFTRYSAIDEYVNGDAYNYIIGASLVAGRMSGIITAKTVCVVGGALCISFGTALMMFFNEKKDNIQIQAEEAQSVKIPVEQDNGQEMVTNQHVLVSDDLPAL